MWCQDQNGLTIFLWVKKSLGNVIVMIMLNYLNCYKTFAIDNKFDCVFSSLQMIAVPKVENVQKDSWI